MKLDVFVDVVCPWSYLGKRWLDAALADFPGAGDVDVRWRSLVLEGREKDDTDGHLTELAAAEGVVLNLAGAPDPNTFDAHRLLLRAPDPGKLLDLLFAAHFADGADIGDLAVLTELGEKAGFEGAGAFLASSDAVEELKEEIGETRAIGFTSTPTIVFEERWAVEGAQPAEVLLELLGQVADDSISERAAGEGGGCCGGGCCG